MTSRAFIWWGMGSQSRAIWTDASAIQASWCLMLLAAVPWTAVANREGDALHALRQALIDPNQALADWDPTLVNPCTWTHITCNSENSVTSLDLHSSGLTGVLVSDLGQLSQLKYLEMYDNSLGGPIPASLGNLSRLVSLELYGNNFTGEIPAELGNLTQLQYLRLNTNNLTGAIPESLTGLDNLQLLDLSYNDLTGDIPVTGVFTKFPDQSFEGNHGLHYPASYFAPAPAKIVPAPSMSRTLTLLNFNSFALRLSMVLVVIKLTAALS